MPHRVSPAERVRGHIDELFASGEPLPEILEDVARLGSYCQDLWIKIF